MKIKQKTIYAIIFVILIGAGLMSALFWTASKGRFL